MLTRMSGRLVVVCLGMFALAGTGRADIIFDGFTSPAPFVQVATIPGGGGAGAAANNQFAVGGLAFGLNRRSITANRSAAGGVVESSVNSSVGNPPVDQYVHSNANGTASTAAIFYDFNGTILDFAGGNITLEDIDQDVGTTMISITLFNGLAQGTSAAQVVGAGLDQDRLFNLADPAFNGIRDHVTAMRINIDTTGNGGPIGIDFNFDALTVPDGTQIIFEVPEPTSMALFGLIGLGGMIAARRKMRKIAA